MLEERYGPIMTVQELQKLLGVGRNRVYEMLNNGTISSIRIGRSWKIPTQAVESYINSWKTNPAVKKKEISTETTSAETKTSTTKDKTSSARKAQKR